MKSPALSFALLLGVSACAGPGGTSPDGGLVYRVPESPSVTYVTGDTSSIEIDAGPMGNMRMRSTGAATVGVTFARAEGGVQVTATIQELNARLTNPMGGAQTATAADVEGDIVFSMDGKGHATVVSLPTTKGAAGQLANPEGMVYEFFPLLPGKAVAPGGTWTDTLHYRIEIDEGNTEATSIMTYTLVGDTLVDGRTLLHIAMTGTGDVTGSGVTEGMDVLQVFSGDITGTILWDPARSLYVSGTFERDMDGTVEVPAAGMPPMPMTVSGRSHVKLQGN
jgi:hypothetical protein